jgi:hypothetical protein
LQIGCRGVVHPAREARPRQGRVSGLSSSRNLRAFPESQASPPCPASISRAA